MPCSPDITRREILSDMCSDAIAEIEPNPLSLGIAILPNAGRSGLDHPLQVNTACRRGSFAPFRDLRQRRVKLSFILAAPGFARRFDECLWLLCRCHLGRLRRASGLHALPGSASARFSAPLTFCSARLLFGLL